MPARLTTLQHQDLNHDLAASRARLVETKAKYTRECVLSQSYLQIAGYECGNLLQGIEDVQHLLAEQRLEEEAVVAPARRKEEGEPAVRCASTQCEPHKMARPASALSVALKGEQERKKKRACDCGASVMHFLPTHSGCLRNPLHNPAHMCRPPALPNKRVPMRLDVHCALSTCEEVEAMVDGTVACVQASLCSVAEDEEEEAGAADANAEPLTAAAEDYELLSCNEVDVMFEAGRTCVLAVLCQEEDEPRCRAGRKDALDSRARSSSQRRYTAPADAAPMPCLVELRPSSPLGCVWETAAKYLQHLCCTGGACREALVGDRGANMPAWLAAECRNLAARHGLLLLQERVQKLQLQQPQQSPAGVSAGAGFAEACSEGAARPHSASARPSAAAAGMHIAEDEEEEEEEEEEEKQQQQQEWQEPEDYDLCNQGEVDEMMRAGCACVLAARSPPAAESSGDKGKTRGKEGKSAEDGGGDSRGLQTGEREGKEGTEWAVMHRAQPENSQQPATAPAQSGGEGLPGLPPAQLAARAWAAAAVHLGEVVASSSLAAPQPLPEAWEYGVDPKTRRTFYWHRSSRASQWDRPG